MVGVVGVHTQTGDRSPSRAENVDHFQGSVVDILLTVDLTETTHTGHLAIPASEEHDVAGPFSLLHKFDGLRARKTCRCIRYTNPDRSGVEIENITRDPNPQILVVIVA